MMTPLMLVFLGTIAAIVSAWAFRHAFTSPDAGMGLVYSAMGMVLWFVFAYSSLHIQVEWDATTEENVTIASEPMALLGLFAGLLMAVLVYQAAIQVFDSETGLIPSGVR